ncbi:transmembrane protein 186 [Paramormyrops kingsleyae]|uniref:Transmembrane protein 186 n=1 Tax=Paramormyrops kingsleyae TaxID=1676925 RepID=A0A3B3Q8N1_9TELE|nr:transmembrane protein 186 [Paramormyrops kingsleyae]
MQRLRHFSCVFIPLTFRCREYSVTVPLRCLLRGIHPVLLENSLISTRQKVGLQQCCHLCTTLHKRGQLKPEDLTSRQFTLIYVFPAIRFLRAVSRLKLLQTGITFVILPPVYYLYFQGQVTYTLISYSTGIAVFAAVMLYSLSHYLRRFVGMMYLDDTKSTLKVSHLTFWGKRKDIYVPVTDIMTLGDTGDTRHETLLRLKQYSCPRTLYFSTQFGRVVDKEGFKQVFGSFS